MFSPLIITAQLFSQVFLDLSKKFPSTCATEVNGGICLAPRNYLTYLKLISFSYCNMRVYDIFRRECWIEIESSPWQHCSSDGLN